MLRPRPSPDSPPMFASGFLDSFSRTHPAIVAILFIPIVIALVGLGVIHAGAGVIQAIGLFVAGVIAWTLVEYWLHRLLFHWEPKASWGPKLHFLLHGVHHDWPNDRFRLVLPPSVSLPLAVLFGAGWWVLMGSWFWYFHGGFLLGYMVYDLTHYYLHHGKIRRRWLRKLQGHHMSHHFNKRYQQRRFGVSSPLWDIVFRTN